MSSLKKQFGDKVFFLRRKKGISQKEMAKLCRFSQSQLSDIERGRYNIQLDTMEIIAQALNVSLSNLFKDVGEDTETNPSVAKA